MRGSLLGVGSDVGGSVRIPVSDLDVAIGGNKPRDVFDKIHCADRPDLACRLLTKGYTVCGRLTAVFHTARPVTPLKVSPSLSPLTLLHTSLLSVVSSPSIVSPAPFGEEAC